VLVVMQNELAKAAQDIERYREIATSVGHTPRRDHPTNISVARAARGAGARRDVSLAQVDSIDATTTSRTALASVKGYEFYGGHGQDVLEDEGPGFRKKATDFYVKSDRRHARRLHPEIAELQRLTGLHILATESASAACRTSRPS